MIRPRPLPSRASRAHLRPRDGLAAAVVATLVVVFAGTHPATAAPVGAPAQASVTGGVSGIGLGVPAARKLALFTPPAGGEVGAGARTFARAGRLDPFRAPTAAPAALPAAPSRGRVYGQAEPAPPETDSHGSTGAADTSATGKNPAPVSGETNNENKATAAGTTNAAGAPSAKTAKTAKTATAKTATATTPVAPLACTTDLQCPDEHICEDGVCHKIEQRTNILYLYYREGTFQEILGLYWAKRGPTGYNVLAPFYWRFYSPTSRSRVVAPFYWHFEDDTIQRTSTVIVPGLPISWSSQPGAKSFGIWPLFYASTKFGWAAPLLGTFKVGDPDAHRATGAIAFLYWWRRTPEASFDLFFPFFVSHRSKASAFTFALPLNFYWRTNQDSKLLALPFFYRHATPKGSSLYSLAGYVSSEGSETSGALLWLYWFGRDSKRKSAHDVVFPLVWSFRHHDDATTIGFPLWWDFKSADARTTIAGPVVHVRRGNAWLNTLLPVWWSGGNLDHGWRFRSLLPLFFWKESDRGARATWLSPIGGYSRDRTAGSRTLVLLPGPIIHRRDPVRDLDIVTPLFIRHHSHEADSTTKLIALLLYLRDDPGGSTSVLFPLFWRFRDAASGATATSLFPFFFHRAGPRDTLTTAGVFPLWFYRRTFAEGGGSAGLFPLAFFGRRGDATHAVVFPVFWHFGNARGSTTVSPLFFASRDREGHDAGIPPLLTFWGDSRTNGSYAIQFPLFWHFANPHQGWSTTVTPIGFFGRTSDGWRAGLGPLLPLIWARGGGPRRHFVLFPVFWHFADDRADESSTLVLNVFHRRRGQETTDAFFPLLYYRRGARPGGANETSFTLFPLVHYRRDANRTMLLTPLGAFARGPQRSGGFLGPYLWYNGPLFSARGVPLLYADVTRKDTQERTRQFGPYLSIDAPDHWARILFPLLGSYGNASERGTYVFPTFFHQRKADGYAVDALLPLFWHSRWRDQTTTVVGPWYRRKSDTVHNTGFVPLYFWAKNPTRTQLIIPPLLTFHRHDWKAQTRTTIVGPFYAHSEPGRDANVLFPFWWSGHDGTRSHRVLGPLYWHFADSADGSSWSLLPPLYWSSSPKGSTFALLPLAWRSHDEDKGITSGGLMPLFYASSGKNQFTLLTLLAGYSRNPLSRRWYAGPLYVSDSAAHSTRVLFPLYFGYRDLAKETTTRIIPPLLFFSRNNPEKSLLTFAGLFWRRTDVASATTLVLPLYFDVHDYRLARTTVLFPLFVRHANEVTGDAYTLAPLFYRHTAPDFATNVLFPFVWDFKRPDRRTTVVFPFYAHWTRPTYTGTYVFPNVYYRKGLQKGAPDGTWRLAIPPLFDADVKRKGDLRWEVLGGLFGKERIGPNHYLKIFFMTFHTKRPTPVQTSWYGRTPTASRTQRRHGLATATW